jgi:hypothetical protein
MGAVVPGEVPVNLIKIVIRESMSQGVMNVRVSTLRRCRVCESWLCPSARLCEDLLRLKRVAEGLSGRDISTGEDAKIGWRVAVSVPRPGRLCVSPRGSISSMKGAVNQ